ncbi:tellurite resistance protein TehA-like permease [Streptomyces sp. TLI_235]|nr:tellurite resistance/C4-dicarboxylate transporter family protein [Streptomyces sp. TLI_235]PBC75424.1 tellurite resistance protein TehA-like permease [Streptomyces sp. TLI_235]
MDLPTVNRADDRSTARWWASLPPAAGSAVMATGIVSVGLHLIGRETSSQVLLALAAAGWLLLALAFALTLLRDRDRWTTNAATPPALTAVAGTTVVGTRFSLSGWQSTGEVLLAIAAVAWPPLLISVLRHWKHHLPGVAFLVCVATEGLAVLAGTLALAGSGDWLAPAAMATFALGLLLYAAALARFDLRQIWTGAGDQWIAAGALAICALAGAKLTAWPEWTGIGHTVLRDLTLVLLSLDLVGYVVLLAAEIGRPRLRYNIRRWATVFPLGISAVATLSTGTATRIAWLDTLGRPLLWIAVAAWLITAAALVVSVARGRGTEEAGRSARGAS